MKWLYFLDCLILIKIIKSEAVNEEYEALSIHTKDAAHQGLKFILDVVLNYEDMSYLFKENIDFEYCLSFYLINSKEESTLKYSCKNNCTKVIKDRSYVPGIRIGPKSCPMGGQISSVYTTNHNESSAIVIGGCYSISISEENKHYLFLIYLIANNYKFFNFNKTYEEIPLNYKLFKGMECQSICDAVMKCKTPENIATIENILFLTFVVATFLYIAYSVIKIMI